MKPWLVCKEHGKLLLGVILSVIITLLTLFITKKLRMAEDKLAPELHRDTQNERLLLEVAEQMQAITHVHQPRSCLVNVLYSCICHIVVPHLLYISLLYTQALVVLVKNGT